MGRETPNSLTGTPELGVKQPIKQTNLLLCEIPKSCACNGPIE